MFVMFIRKKKTSFKTYNVAEKFDAICCYFIWSRSGISNAFKCRFSSDIRQLNSKAKGDDQDASALRDEVCL